MLLPEELGHLDTHRNETQRRANQEANHRRLEHYREPLVDRTVRTINFNCFLPGINRFLKQEAQNLRGTRANNEDICRAVRIPNASR